MRYRVIGSDAKSKKPIELVIEAADEGAARADSAARGVVVERVVGAEAGANEKPGPSPMVGVRDGGPVVVRMEPGYVQLIELTGKRWKGLLVVSLAMMTVGVIVGGWFVLRDPRSLAHPPLMAWVGGVLAIAGLVGVVIARVGAWWGHG